MTRPTATGTPELDDTGDALKLDDTEDAVVGPVRSEPQTSSRTRNGFDLGRAAPDADRREETLPNLSYRCRGRIFCHPTWYYLSDLLLAREILCFC